MNIVIISTIEGNNGQCCAGNIKNVRLCRKRDNKYSGRMLAKQSIT